MYKPVDYIGFGNVLLQLVDYLSIHGIDSPVHEDLKNFERGNAFDFSVNMQGDDGSPNIPGGTFLNKNSKILSKIMKPTESLLSLCKNVEGYVGIHIRCGNSMPDCKGLASNDDWFTTDKSIETFHKIIEETNSKIFLISDSLLVKKMFKERWGDRIEMYDTDITLSCAPGTCGGVKQTPESLMQTYAEWYTLSQCSVIVTTSGPGYKDINLGMGVSTFGFTSAAYGEKAWHVVTPDGRLLTPSH